MTASLREIAAASERDRSLIAARRGLTMDGGETPDKVAALLDTARALDEIAWSSVPRSKDGSNASCTGDVPDPDEGW